MIRKGKSIRIITNNEKIIEFYQAELPVLYAESYLDVLSQTRDYIHQGYSLLTHPMSGSLKPNQTPYKTIILEQRGVGEKAVDLQSLEYIEDAIEVYHKFQEVRKMPKWSEKTRQDFRTIDASFMKSAVAKL